MRRAAQPRFVLEMALVRLTEIRHLESLDGILEQLRALEGRLPGGPGQTQAEELPLFAAPPPTPVPTPAARPSRSQPMRAAAAPPRPPSPPVPPAAEPVSRQSGPRAGVPDAPAAWQAAVERLATRKRLASVLSEVRLAGVEGDRLVLEVPNGNAFMRDSLEDPQTKRLLIDTIGQVMGGPVRIEYRFIAATPQANGAAEARPRMSPEQHPLVREALSVLGGTIVPGDNAIAGG
jgi:hypothetical protein